MEKLCTILTTDDDGGSSLPVDTFIEMYTYLANIDGDIAQEEIEAVVEYAGRVAQLQDGYVNRFNLKSPLCPALHWFTTKNFRLQSDPMYYPNYTNKPLKSPHDKSNHKL